MEAQRQIRDIILKVLLPFHYGEDNASKVQLTFPPVEVQTYIWNPMREKAVWDRKFDISPFIC